MVKESTCNAGDMGSIPELGRFPGGKNGNPLHCSCLENLIDKGVWQAYSPWGPKGQTQLSYRAHKPTNESVKL